MTAYLDCIRRCYLSHGAIPRKMTYFLPAYWNNAYIHAYLYALVRLDRQRVSFDSQARYHLIGCTELCNRSCGNITFIRSHNYTVNTNVQ